MKTCFVVPLLLLVEAVHSMSALAQSQGAFAPTGDMTTERQGHTATLLTNGKVLIAGGSAILTGWPVWATAELYDPLTGTFALTGSMTTPCTGHSATLLPDGKVLIAGGFASMGDGTAPAAFLANAELYNPSTGIFTATGAMTMPRSGHTATLLNTGKVLITGGASTNHPGAEGSTAELYDPVTGTFSATGSMAAARTDHVAVLLANGKVLIAGGNAWNCDPQSSPEIYDPASGQFTLAGPSAYSPDSGLSTVSASLLPNGNVLALLVGGCGFDNRAEVYDAASGRFTATASFIEGYITATLLPEGRVLITGRSFPDGSAELYDPAAGALAAVDDTLPQRQSGYTATLLPDGSVLLAGGWICCGYSLAKAAVYHPAHPVPSPVLYSLPGGSQGAILHAGTQQIVSPANPAVAGEVVEIYGAGLIDGGAIPPQVSIGGRLAEVLFFGNAPGYSGLNQINARVPAGVAPGPAVTVRLNYLGRPSNEVAIGVK
jgi:hypothetical protein